MKLASRHFLVWMAAATVALALAKPPPCSAQLIVEDPSRKWRAGETIELIVRGREVRAGDRIEEVRFDDRPVAFELVDLGSEGDVIRIRIRVPTVVRPGAHQVSVRFSEESRPRSTVPELRGMELAEARRLLAESGLSAATSGARPPEGAFLVVTGQEPGAGARLSRGARVALEVAGRSRVPEIVGLAVEEARLELGRRALELAGAGETTAALAQTVWTQDPPPGALVAPGSAVTVETTVSVPTLIGRQAEEVRPILVAAGLRPRMVFVEPDRAPHRTVVGQDPAAGESVPPGSRIAVVFERLAELPPPRLPWGWMALTAALGGALAQQRVRVRRKGRKTFRVKVSKDLDGLRQSATPPAWEGRELKLDVRLLGIPDRGSQTLEIDGPLVAEAQGP